MSNPKPKLTQRILRYFLNLWVAITGRNPYQEELAALSGRVDRIVSNTDKMREFYNECVKKWGEAVVALKDLDKELQEKKCENSRYQKLVETLRQHLSDKDKLIKRMKADYQERIDQYMKKIEELKGK